MLTELQAVILAAGKGSRIHELSSKTAKCLLPVANKPIIYYPLDLLQRSSFQEVIVLVPDVHEEAVKQTINELKFDLRVDLVSVPFNRDSGTADSLRFIKDKIKNDLLILTCDIITDFPLDHLINLYRIHDPTLISLVSSLPQSTEGSVPGRKGKDRPEKDLIGIDKNNSNRLVFLSSEADFDESVPFRLSMLKKCPQFDVYSNYLDAHVYILKKWTLKYLEENSNISSLKGEFLPSLVRKQFRKERKPIIEKSDPHPSSVISTQTNLHKQIFNFIETDEIELNLQKLQPYDENILNDDGFKQLIPNKYPDSKIKCFAFIINEGFCVRANTLAGFCEANRIMLRKFTSSDRKVMKTPTSPGVNLKAQVDCLVANVKSIGDKISLKRTIIGNNCIIGDKVKLTNSIIMDNVVIEEGCNIQGSIICSNAHIGNNAEIKDCIIAAGQTVVSLGKFTNEVIMDIEQMMEL